MTGIKGKVIAGVVFFAGVVISLAILNRVKFVAPIKNLASGPGTTPTPPPAS